MSTPVVLREVVLGDLDELVELCAAHAHYERADFEREHKAEALAQLLLGDAARAHGLVADTDRGLAGYATWSREFSTWKACEYAHMDCLYLRPEWRGAGVGTALMRALAEQAAREGLDFLEWQTPSWNRRAIELYHRLGATSSQKLRFDIGTDTLLSAAPKRTGVGCEGRGYARRSLSFLGLERWKDWRIKLYGLSAAGPSPSETLVRSALERSLPHLPQPACEGARLGLGYLLVHEGKDACWVRLEWWYDESIVQHLLFRAPLDAPAELELMPAGTNLACVWELKLVQFECDAWIEHVLSRLPHPDLAGYLSRVFEGSI